MALSSSTFSGLGSAAGSIFGAIGSFDQAAGYSQAANYSRQNAQIAQQSALIQDQMAQRKVYQTLGGQQSDIAGAGLASSGSALDVVRSSAEQGSLTKQLVQAQGQINVQGYQAEASSYDAMSKAATSAGTGGILGGLMQGAGALFRLFSDDRLKENSVLVERRRDGLGIYEFSYKGSTDRFRGVMASEVERMYPAAVTTDPEGFRKVNYAMLNVVPEKV